MITISDAMRRPAEVERDELKKQLADARAEIERLQTELRQNADSCAETNLEIDWCKACTSRKWCAAGQSLVEKSDVKTELVGNKEGGSR